MSKLKDRDLHIPQTLEKWRTEAIDHVEDPGVSPESACFREDTDKLVSWCDQNGIDPTAIRDTYCRIRAWRHPGGWVGLRQPKEVLHEEMRRAIGVCDRIQNQVTLRAKEKGESRSIPSHAHLNERPHLRAKKKGGSGSIPSHSHLNKRPHLNDTDTKALQYIKEHPGEAGKNIALAISVSPSHFRRMARTLKMWGVSNKGEGYYPPQTM